MVCKFLITGGQLAGKDTVILRLKEDLEKHGYFVVYTNEIAEYIMLHNIRPFGDERIAPISFQDAVFKTQIFTEELYLSKIHEISTKKPIVFLINRGLLDGKAFLREKDFQWICENNHYNIEDIRNRYDIVFCLETMAKLGVYNQHDNNEVRFQNMQEAIEMNDKFFEDYKLYFDNVVYFKSNKIFEDKYKEILDSALNSLKEWSEKYRSKDLKFNK